jgi:hypothetical protein
MKGRRVDFRLEACMVRGTWVYKDAAIQAGPIGEFISSGSAADSAGSAAGSLPA